MTIKATPIRIPDLPVATSAGGTDWVLIYQDGTTKKISVSTLVSVPAVTWGSITGKPTTVGGFGITDAYTKAEVDTALSGKAASSHTHSAATTSVAGFMSAADKAKLDGVAAGATNYTHPANHPASIITQDASNRFVTDAEKATWNAKQAALGYTPENTANKGAANGYASLDAGGKVPTTQLPSFVDDVLEFANLAAFPGTGETGKIYVALDTNKTYRWSGTAYVYITSGAVDSVAGKTGVVTLVKADVGLGNVDNTSDANKPVSTATQTALNAKEGTIAAGTTAQYWRGDKTWADLFADVRAATLTGLSTATNAVITAADTVLSALGKLQAQITAHFGAGGSAHANATTSVAGFMTAADKTKLDGVATGATANIGTVTSVAATVPAFLSVTGSPITSSGTIVIGYSGTALPVANGGTGGTTAAAARTALSAAESTQQAGSAFDFNSYLPATPGLLRVVWNSGDTSMVNAPNGNTTGFLLASQGSHNLWNSQLFAEQGAAGSLWYRGSSDASGTRSWGTWNRLLTHLNYNNWVPSLTGTGASGTWGISVTGNAATVTNGVYTTGSYADPGWIVSLNYSKLTGTVPTWNQNTTGSAATLSTGRTIGMTGDVTWTSAAFNGSGNVTGVATLANTGVTAGTYNDVATQVRPYIVDAKGRITGVGAAITITPAWGSITGKPTTVGGFGITDAYTKAEVDTALSGKAASSHTHSSDAITEGSTNLFHTGARVLAVVASGLSTATNAVITAADTVLGALGKLQAQITANLGTLTSHTGNTSNPHGVTKAQVGLGNVENTALSTWGGSANIATVGTLNGLTFSGSLYRVGGTSIAYWLQQDGTGRSHWYWGTSGGTAPTFATAGEDAGNIRISVSNAGAGANFTFRSASGVGKAAGDAITFTDVLFADLASFTYKGNTVWRADNDGAGSGLDADLLDGQQGSFYQNASNLNAGTVPAARLPAASWTDQGAMSAADKQKLDGMATGQPGSATWFTSSGTWTRPSLSLFTFAVVELWGAGGGGGGGQRYYNADRRMGGTGGGGGAYRRMQFLLADLPSSVTVTIGAGGTGGAGSASLGATPGNGQDGGATTFGSILQAYGGKGGPALVPGSTTTQIGGRGAGVTQPDTANEAIAWGTGGNGGQQTPGGNANDVGAPSGAAGAGGGAGGGLSAANAAINGRNGGANSAAKAGGTGATTQGTAGGNGALFGEGGGGGGWGLTANAGNGGNGNVAGGGGGGGASTDTYLPGNGGNGGPGRCVVYVW